MPSAAQIRLSELPSLRMSEIGRLPDIGAVYIAATCESRVLYVGQTVFLARRWRTHHRLEQIQQEPDARIFWIPESNPEAARRLENALIERFQPELNWTEHPVSEKRMSTIAVRVPSHVAEFYEELARRERRKLSDTIRLVLTDYAKRGN